MRVFRWLKEEVPVGRWLLLLVVLSIIDRYAEAENWAMVGAIVVVSALVVLVNVIQMRREHGCP